MNEIKQILFDLSVGLNNCENTIGDLSDVGNEIGIIIAKYIDNNKIGYEKYDFINGIRHGISLVDGSHF